MEPEEEHLQTPANREPCYPGLPRPSESETLLPNEHLRLLAELLRPEGMELARRWMAALTLVPEDQRPAIVDAVEAQIISEFVNTPER